MMPLNIFAALTMTLMALAFVGTFDRYDVERQAERYCEMVDLYKQTDGEQGWPDYRDVYKERCK